MAQLAPALVDQRLHAPLRRVVVGGGSVAAAVLLLFAVAVPLTVSGLVGRERTMAAPTGLALDDIPDELWAQVSNVAVVVEDEHPEEPDLLGLYEGIPLTERGAGYAGVLPDRITLFRRTLSAGRPNDEELRRRVRHTVVHEFAHFFGISDDRLRELDRY